MFDDNWILYLFIIMVLFGRDGEIAGTELIVLFASTLAVLIGENGNGCFFVCHGQACTWLVGPLESPRSTKCIA